MNFLVQIRRFLRASIVGLVVLLIITSFFLASQFLISGAQDKLSELQGYIYRETSIMTGLQEKFSFLSKYQDRSPAFRGAWQQVLADILPEMETLRQSNEARNALVDDLARDPLIVGFTDFKKDVTRVQESDLRLRQWAYDGVHALAGAEDLSIADLGPLQSGLIARGTWIGHAGDAFENLSKARAQLENLQRTNFLALIAAATLVLSGLIRFFLFPAMRGALEARQLERKEMNLRHALVLLPQNLGQSFAIRAGDWQQFFEVKAPAPRIIQDRFLVTFSYDHQAEDARQIDQKDHHAHVAFQSDTLGEGMLVTRLYFPEEWASQKGLLQRTAERLHNTMVEARHRYIAHALEADRDTYFAFLRASLDSLPVAMGLFNTDDELVVCNKQFLKTLKAFGVNIQKEDPLSDCVRALETQETRTAILLKEMFLKREDYQFECMVDGTTYHWQSVLVPDRGILFCAQDITAEIARAEARYNERRLESLGRFSGGVSHDVNNFLSIIMNNIELVRDMPDDAMRADCINEAVQACLDAGRINKQLLSYARKQPLVPRAVNPRDLIASCEKYAQQWKRDVDLTTRLTSKNWVWADESGLKSAMINLLKNALEATTLGQRIELDISDADISMGAALKITIRDNGPGFADADPDRYLEPFYSTKPTGSGLGLSAVEGFAKQSSGQFSMKNRRDCSGAEITITLPAVPGRQDGPCAVRPKINAQHGCKNILIVDDNLQMLRAMELALTAPSFEIVKAISVTTALKQIEAAETQALDLLVSDVMLPDGVGFDIAKRFKSRFPNGEILLISGFPSDHFDTNILDVHANFLAKPFPIDMLKKQVRDLLHAETTV